MSSYIFHPIFFENEFCFFFKFMCFCAFFTKLIWLYCTVSCIHIIIFILWFLCNWNVRLLFRSLQNKKKKLNKTQFWNKLQEKIYDWFAILTIQNCLCLVFLCFCCVTLNAQRNDVPKVGYICSSSNLHFWASSTWFYFLWAKTFFSTIMAQLRLWGFR